MNNPTAEAIAQAVTEQVEHNSLFLHGQRVISVADLNAAAKRIDASRAEQAGGVSTEAMDALRNHQQQLDADGIMVGVSRQALDELLAALTKPKDGEAQQIGSVSSVMRDANAQSTELEHPQLPCGCGLSTCVEPWEPGCGLGTSMEHAVPVEPQRPDGGEWKLVPIRADDAMRYAGSERMQTRKWESEFAEVNDIYDAMLAAAPAPPAVGEGVPIPMLLFCPRCHVQHVDAPDERTPEWENPPHRSHLCHGCGCIWRPADVATVGVASIETKGKADNWDANTAPPSREGAHRADFEDWLREQYNHIPINTVSTVDDRYLSPDACRMWSAWEEASSRLSAAPRQVVGEAVAFAEMVESEWKFNPLKSASKESLTTLRHGAHLYLHPLKPAQPAPGAVDETTLRQALFAMKRCQEESGSSMWKPYIHKLKAALNAIRPGG